MRMRTHLLFSLFILVLLYRFHLFPSFSVSLFYLLLFSSTLLFFTLVPDIDTSESYLGRRVFPISWILSLLFGHRRFFHSLLFALLLFSLPWLFGFELFAIAAGLGISSHLLMDALTREGVYPLYPLSFRVHGPISTGGLVELLFSCGLVLGILIFLI